MSSAGLLLAAGQSRRFGAENKLLAMLDGLPLVAHAAGALRASGLSPLVAVVGDPALLPHLDGFQTIDAGPGAPAQSQSLRTGVAGLGDATRITVTLGDMPRVTPALIAEIAALCPEGGASAARAGALTMPPACFHKDLFPALLAMEGDRGAGALLREIPDAFCVETEPKTLSDVDRPDDLAAL